MRAIISPFLLALALFCSTAEAVEPFYMVVTEPTPLMRGTETVTSLMAGDLVTATKRNGKWIWANAQGQEGWLQYGHLRAPNGVEDFHRHTKWLKWNKRLDEAIALTQSLDSHYGRHWQTSYIRGDIFREQKDPRAEDALEDAIRLVDESAHRPFPYDIAPIYASLSQVHRDQGKYRLAIADYDRAFRSGGIVASDQRHGWRVHLSHLQDSQARLWAGVGEFDLAVQVKRHAQLVREKAGRFDSEIASWLLKARRPLEVLDLCNTRPESDFESTQAGGTNEYNERRKADYGRDVAKAKAEAFAQCGRFEEAGQELRTIRESYVQEPPSCQVDCLSAEIQFWLSHGDIKRADEVFAEATSLTKQHPKIYFPRACYLKELGRYTDIVADLRTKVESDPTNVSGLDALAWHLATSSRKGDRDPDEALRRSEQAIQLAPKSQLHYETKAAALAATGRFSEACNVQRQAVELAPEKYRRSYSNNLALLQSRHLIITYEDRDFLTAGDIAIVLYDEAALESENNAEPTYVKFGEHLPVIGHYKHFLAVLKDGERRWIRRIEIGSSAQYLKRLKQKLTLDLTSEHLLLRADEYLQRREFELALNDVEAAIDLSPDDAQAAIKKAWILAACPLHSGTTEENPLLFAELTARQHPTSPDARSVLAIAQAKSGRFEEAMKTLKTYSGKRVENAFVDITDLRTLFENRIPYVMSRYR